MSLSSAVVDVDVKQVFTQIGTYKGSIVAIKRIRKKHVDLTRNVRKELKIVSRLSHGPLILWYTIYFLLIITH